MGQEITQFAIFGLIDQCFSGEKKIKWTLYIKIKTQGKIGTGEISQQQLNWLESKFNDGQPRHITPYGFEEWKRWREADGFVCDEDQDCKWISWGMECREGQVGTERGGLSFARF